MISPLPPAGADAVAHPTARCGTMSRPRRIRLLMAILAIAIPSTAPDLAAQQGQAADIPTLEPHFTRIYSADAPTQLRFPSLSPDGRWILFSTWGTDLQGGLWLVPAEGGEAIRLTEGHWDDGPLWFPSGDRIAFRSDRPARGGNGGSYIMTLAIDPATGWPVGAPRQVSVDRCFAWLDVSPDGEWIAFSGRAGDRKAVMAVPSEGGASRIVARETTSRPVWSPDGESIYYTVPPPAGAGEILVRVSARGSAPDTVFAWPREVDIFGFPESRFVLRLLSGDGGRNHPSVWEVATLDGRPLGRVELPPGTGSAFSVTPAGELLVVRSEGSAPLEVLPIDGGAPRRLNDSGANDRVLGWSPDGRRVLFETSLDGEDLFFFAPTDGGAMRQLDLPEQPLNAFAPVLSRDGRRLLYTVAGADSGTVTLKVLDIGAGAARAITDDFFLPDFTTFGLTGRGGIQWRDGDDFLYVEQHGDRFDLRALPPSGASRLLRTFQDAPPPEIAVFGDRIAYKLSRDVSADERRNSLVLARAGSGESHAILSIRGVFESPTWSPDGRYLTVDAFERSADGASDSLELLVLDVDPSGEVIGEPTVLDTPDGPWWWSPRWLPDGRGLLVQTEDGRIWRVSTEPGIRPVDVTADLPPNHTAWDFHVSPGGRSIAYARNIFRSSSIWRVDLGGALAAGGR